MSLIFYFIFFSIYITSTFIIFKLIKSKNKFISSLFIVISLLIGLLFFAKKERIFKRVKSLFKEVKIATLNTNCETTIYSLNVHKDDYTRLHRPLAIKTTNNGYIKNQQILNQFLQNKKIVEIEEGDGYYIQNLAHSSKHLTPLAYKRLKELGTLYRSFITIEKEKKSYFIISSMTRDESQQNEVRVSNPRTATKDLSTHSFGVSFDIALLKSMSNNCNHCCDALSKALTKMQKEGKILICSESSCIHITVIH